MIAHFPIALLVPGLLFIAGGLFYRYRAARMIRDGTIAKYVAEATIKSSNISFVFGIIALVIAVPLGLEIRSML